MYAWSIHFCEGINVLVCYISFISRLHLVDLWVSMFWWVDLQQHIRRHTSLWSSKPPLWHRRVEQGYRSWRHNYCACMQSLSYCTYMISKVPSCAFWGAKDTWDSYTITIKNVRFQERMHPEFSYLDQIQNGRQSVTIYLNRPDMSNPC